MYNAELVRHLCVEIAAEKDPEKTRDLLLLLQAIIQDDVEDIRIRMAFFAKKYPMDDSESQSAD
jgi:hypothetical protein